MHILILIPLIVVHTNANLRFDDYEVQRVIPKTAQQLKFFQELEDTSEGYSFWKSASTVDRAIDIVVPPKLKEDFKNITALYKLESDTWIPNIQELIDNEKNSNLKASTEFDWQQYHTLDQINAWLNSLQQKYPGIVEVVNGGKSYEGRNITGVKVSFKPGNKGVFIEGGIHAREWIAPAVVTYIVNEFLTSNDISVRQVAESRDWYFFPSVNPDGFVYTHTSNRLWRKTRKPYGFCYGADPNRNWGYYWLQGGASRNPCVDTFAGSSAFSEIETRTLAQYISTFANTLDSYIAFHSYSQLLLLPFGHSGREVPTNNEELLRIGRNAANTLSKRYGTIYTVGNIPDAIYVGSGGSMDWAAGVYRNIRLAYTYELRDTGRYGFLLPPSLILPTCEETLDSIISIFRQADGLE